MLAFECAYAGALHQVLRVMAITRKAQRKAPQPWQQRR
jgi:hypothetical protein